VLDNVGSSAFKLLRSATTSDAVLAVSFMPCDSITPELTASAARSGVPIVSLTDGAFSPPAATSKTYLEVVEETIPASRRFRRTGRRDGAGEAHEHPNTEIVGICDPDGARLAGAIKSFAISSDRVFHDIERCVRETKPDLAILCPATARHADCVEAVAPLGVDILLEKPFAASLSDADRILAAVGKAGVRLAVNWPLRWYAPHVTAKRMIDEGAIGDLSEVHFYDGNRGPLYHRADKVVVSEDEVRREKPTSWWYRKSAGGGSLLDYLGYGATLGTWFMKGEAPLEVTSVVDQPEGLEVDEHSITICRYRRGLSKLETRWGAFTDPWITQPQPKCGFVMVGTEGTISSYDFEPHVAIQTRAQPEIQNLPVDVLEAPFRKPVEYVLHCREKGVAFEGPLDPVLCRTAQRIVDTAALSARERRTLPLLA
jgi:predicted dehydrogenase